MERKSALVLFSGGQDSTTCLFWALKQFSDVRTLCFAYGQRHGQEVEVARAIAATIPVPFQLLDVSIIGKLADNALINPDIIMDEEQPRDSYPNTFVPGRNLLFLTFAAVIARSHGIKDIVAGVSEADFSGYPDCREAFIRSANITLNLAMDEDFILHTPLMPRNKAQVWELADDLGVFDRVKNETLTCYNGIIADGCGHCPACRLRNRGLQQFLETKNTKYARQG